MGARLTSNHGTHVHRAPGRKGAPERRGHNSLLNNVQYPYRQMHSSSSNFIKVPFWPVLYPGPRCGSLRRCTDLLVGWARDNPPPLDDCCLDPRGSHLIALGASSVLAPHFLVGPCPECIVNSSFRAFHLRRQFGVFIDGAGGQSNILMCIISLPATSMQSCPLLAMTVRIT